MTCNLVICVQRMSRRDTVSRWRYQATKIARLAIADKA